jgi:cytochrome c peroxidase
MADGRIVAWASTRPNEFPAGETFTYAAVYDPSTGQITALNNTAHDMFCAGLAQTGDGRVLASGGGADVRTTSAIGITQRWPQTWSRLGDMTGRRWYNTSVTLPSGNVLTMWGRSGGTLTELFDQTQNIWNPLPGVTIDSLSDPADGVDDDHQWFPHMYMMPNGRILMAGPLRTMRWIDFGGLGSWQDIGNRTPDGQRHRKLGASVQFLPGKILFTGGRDDRYSPRVTNSAVVIDTTSGSVVTTATGPMSYARAFHNLVMLPNGEVMALTGNTSGTKFSDNGGVLPAEIWNPSTGLWRTVASMAIPRGYHSVGILLRDGRVLVGGGGLCACLADHSDSQIYEPPYLFNSDGTPAVRPRIDLVSPDWKPGISIGLKGSDDITGFRLIRLQAATHGMNSDQRYVPVTFTKSGPGSYNLATDANPNVLIPGMYWLFALTASGTPSIGYPVQMYTAGTWPGTLAGDTNLAKGKPASQSSTEWGAAASRAVDGNTDGVLANQSVSHTALQAQPYWQVDLGASAQLSSVRIWNRTDCCMDRLGNFHVFLSNQPITGTTVAQARAQAGVIDLHYPGIAGASVSIPAATAARYVRVQLEGTSYFHVAEVEVLGKVISNSAPSVTIGSPASGVSAAAPANFLISASVSDADNNVSRVEFFEGTRKLGELAAAPYSFSWNAVPAGSYTIRVRATDSGGLAGEASVNVTVTNSGTPNQPPVISIRNPIDGALMSAPASTTIDVAATDPDNNLARVELFQGAVKLAERTSAPFLFPVNNIEPGTHSYTARATDSLGLSTSVTITLRVLSRQVQSLKGVPVPEPSSLQSFLKNRAAAIALGKALFWDTQLASDGTIACASCHFQAGADPRLKNQMNPGTLRTGSPAMTFDNSRTGTVNGPNYHVKAGDFPRHVLADPLNPNSTLLYQSKDVMGSHGVFRRNFVSTTSGAAQDSCVDASDPIFGGFRQVTGRNAPTVINAVFNLRNFWDGRANSTFNGVDGSGPRNTAAVIYRGTPPAPVRIALDNASLASQAVVSPLNPAEMSCAGRTWPEIGKRLLSRTALAGQSVATTDSVLGGMAATGGARGLNRTYDTMVRAAFADDLHASTSSISLNGTNYTQIQANFSLFFGLAVQLYQSTLVSDQAPIDSFLADYPSTAIRNSSALPPDVVAGWNVFNGKGRCVNCHHGPELTNAGTPAREAAAIGALISRMRMGDGAAGAYDLGYYNIGVRPAADDRGLGSVDPFGVPLSFTRQAKAAALRDNISVDSCTFEIEPCAPLTTGSRDVVDGAFKTPSLRNVSLTGPYFHNGSVATLEDVVEFYDRGGNARGTVDANSTGFGPNLTNAHADIRPLALTQQEKSSLVAFLKFALLDDRVLYERAPFDHPELPVVNGHSGTATDTFLLPAVGSGGRASAVLPFEHLLLATSGGPVAVGRWPMDGVVGGQTADASGNNNAGVVSGSYTETGGMIGGALQLNAANGGVVTQRSVIDPTRSYTVSVWVNMTNTNGTQTFVSLPGSDVSNFYLQRAGWLNGGFAMDVFSADSSSSAYYVAASTTIPVANRWYHVTGVHDAEARRVRVYVDGRLEAEAAAPNGSFANSGPLAFGYAKYSGTRHDGTDARLDDVRVFNRALTSAEVAAVFQDTGAPAAAAPVVAMTAPAGGTSYTAPATVSLSATATTTDGTIARVEFYNGGTLLGTDTTAPYTYSWSGVAAGSYTLTARAVGSNGQATVSAPASITVTTAAAAPVVAMTAPAGGTSYTAPATVSLSATATTTDGTIARVEFYNGGTLLGTDTAAPYSFSWSSVAAGTYTLTAQGGRQQRPGNGISTGEHHGDNGHRGRTGGGRTVADGRSGGRADGGRIREQQRGNCER